jgi:hypothetical protein
VTPEELLERVQASRDSETRRKLLADVVNQGLLAPGTDIGIVIDWIRSNAPEDLDFYETTWNVEAPLVQGRLDEEAAARSKIDSQARILATDPESDGGEEITDEERKAAESDGATLIPTVTEPRWIQDQYGLLSQAQKDRLLRNVQIRYGESFTSFEELVASGFLDDPTNEVQTFVNASIMDTRLESAFQFELPSGDLFTVRAEGWVYANDKYGIDEQEMISLIGMAETLGVKDGSGKVAWQPVLALANATGLLDELKPVQRDRIVGGPGGTDMGITPDNARPRRITDVLEQSPNQSFFERSAGNVNTSVLRGERLAAPQTRFSFTEVMEQYQLGLSKFNYDPAMAYIYALDPNLAGRIGAAGGDPTKIRGQDLQRVAALAQDGELVREEWWAASGLPIIQNFLQMEQARTDPSSGGAGGGSTTVRQKPDPATLNEQLRSLYQSMFLEEPDEGDLAAFRSQINAAVEGMEPGDSVDVSARAKEFARGDERYERLYGRKPANVSEEEYQGQFRNAQASMLGAEVAGNESVIAGMRSGKYQTTVGAAAGTTEAWDNSTFLGRLARVGQLVGEMT